MVADNFLYHNSMSFAFIWQLYRIKAYSDENVSREIMQHFTIGTTELNQDGTAKINKDGNIILFYTNDDSMSFSIAWTGFSQQLERGNIDSVGKRLIDPMQIEAEWRDIFPKTNLYGGYKGDTYPLFVDLPSKSFLPIGATYCLLGSSRLPELMKDPSMFLSDNMVNRFVLDNASNLKLLIYNEESGECRYRNYFTVESPISCTEIEYDVDTLRVVLVAEDIYYEYVEVPCVQYVFYGNAKKLSKGNGRDSLCGNPLLPVAAEAMLQLVMQ